MLIRLPNIFLITTYPSYKGAEDIYHRFYPISKKKLVWMHFFHYASLPDRTANSLHFDSNVLVNLQTNPNSSHLGSRFLSMGFSIFLSIRSGV